MIGRPCSPVVVAAVVLVVVVITERRRRRRSTTVVTTTTTAAAIVVVVTARRRRGRRSTAVVVVVRIVPRRRRRCMTGRVDATRKLVEGGGSVAFLLVEVVPRVAVCRPVVMQTASQAGRRTWGTLGASTIVGGMRTIPASKKTSVIVVALLRALLFLAGDLARTALTRDDILLDRVEVLRVTTG